MNQEIPFKPLQYFPRSYVRGADFWKFALSVLIKEDDQTEKGLDIRFPRFTVHQGKFVKIPALGKKQDTPAIVIITSNDKKEFYLYEETKHQAKKSKDDPEASFINTEKINDMSGTLNEVPSLGLTDSIIYLIKILHQKSLGNESKWIFTRFQSQNISFLCELLKENRSVDIKASILSSRSNTTVSQIQVSGTSIGEIYFARI